MSEQPSTDLAALAAAEGVEVDLASTRKVVVVQGLGFVGSAMATACAALTRKSKNAQPIHTGRTMPA